MRNVLVIEGAVFVGSHLLRLMVNKYSNYDILNIDLLTYLRLYGN